VDMWTNVCVCMCAYTEETRVLCVDMQENAYVSLYIQRKPISTISTCNTWVSSVYTEENADVCIYRGNPGVACGYGGYLVECVCVYIQRNTRSCAWMWQTLREMCVYMCIYGGNPGAVDTADIRRNVDVLI